MKIMKTKNKKIYEKIKNKLILLIIFHVRNKQNKQNNVVYCNICVENKPKTKRKKAWDASIKASN